MSVNGSAAAVFGIADEPRSEAASAIARLNNVGVETLMVTGDTEKTARYIATKVGLDQVVANAKPDEKLNIIRKFQAVGKKVGMIGDGLNDAPALAAADVGFAIGCGTGVAIESADLTLVKDDISKVTETIELSTDTIKLDVPVFNYCFSETQKNKALEKSQLSTCTDFYRGKINASPLVFYG